MDVVKEGIWFAMFSLLTLTFITVITNIKHSNST